MIALIIIITILASLADVCLKVGAAETGSLLSNPLQLALIPWIWLGAVLGVAAISLWIYVLSKHHISHAYPIFVGLTFLNITLASWIYLDEHIGWRRLAGIAVVLLGILVVHTTSTTEKAQPPVTGKNPAGGG
jgi:multidrug transporter EmrE-like cation transporter